MSDTNNNDIEVSNNHNNAADMSTDAADTDVFNSMRAAVRHILTNTKIDENFTYKNIKDILKQTYKKKQLKQYNDSIKQYVNDLVSELQSSTIPVNNVNQLPSIGDDEIGDADADDMDYNDDMDNNSDNQDWNNKSKKKKIPRKKQKSTKSDTHQSANKPARSRKTGPRTPRNAFQWYKDEMRQHTSNIEEIREQWLSMTEEEQLQYHDKAKTDKIRYKQEMEQLKLDDIELYTDIMSRRKIKLDDDLTSNELDVAIKSIKQSRSNKQFDEDDAQVDNVVAKLIQQMDTAYQNDIIAYNNNQPAVSKLQLLPLVDNLCSNSHIWQVLRNDGKILRCFRDWLSIHMNQLPNIKLRSTIYELCNKNTISSDDLESSTGIDDSNRESRGIALSEQLMNLYFHADETQSNKKLLRAILERWIRLVISGGDSESLPMTYKELEKSEQIKRAQIHERRNELIEQKNSNIMSAQLKAKFPERAAFDYVYRPSSSVNVGRALDERDERAELDDRRSQMKKKLAARSKMANVKKNNYKVDMAGRKTG